MKNAERGFSAMEVIMAMTLFTIGAAGVIAMERTSIRGNSEARQLDIASMISREWMERLRRDSVRWGALDSNGNPTKPSQLLWLKDTGLGPTVGVNSFASGTGGAWIYPKKTAGNWPVPTPGAPIDETFPLTSAPGASAAFDLLGHERPGSANSLFCAQYRLQAVQHNPATSLALDDTTLIRAEVRVFWPRNLGGIGANFCSIADDAVANDPVLGPKTYMYLYASTILRETNP